MKQRSFSSYEHSQKKKRTKRDVFLAEMEAVVPWSRLEALISPYYTKPRKPRPQMGLSVMLRIYFLQQWYGLSDPGAKEALFPIILRYGKPEYIRSDNGPEFISDVYQSWLKRVNIKPIHIYPGSPWENGDNERFNGTLRHELLDAKWFITTQQAQTTIAQHS